VSVIASSDRGELHHVLHEASDPAEPAPRARLTPGAVLAAWRALHEGRWAVVESGEREGRRFLVARPDTPLSSSAPATSAEASGHGHPEGLPQLSAQERRVLSVLAKGYSNKLIAHELGLATSTVGTLLARAARKLGCSSRIALARAGRALANDLADPHHDSELA
jgi:DNA-binding NarL/FixJ family response regulator